MRKSEEFLNSFNRIEKWLRDQLGNPGSMGFSEMVRRLGRKSDLQVREFEDDLLQMAQLRNAIVHEKISDTFVIAEPNEWAVERIKAIELQLTQPEKVLPKFGKNVTGFERSVPVTDILKIIAKKKFSQFPLYNKGKFEGLITLRGIGFWLALEAQKGDITLKGRRAEELIIENGKSANYRFVSEDTYVYQVEKMFYKYANLEAVMITKDGDPDGNLLGIIRPRDIYQGEKD